jgi:hypothetical protein
MATWQTDFQEKEFLLSILPVLSDKENPLLHKSRRQEGKPV